MRETQFLSLVAIIPNESQILIELTQLASKHSCLITQSHINQQADSYFVNMVLSGTWSAIAKIEASLNSFQKKNKLTFLMQRLTYPASKKTMMPYNIYIVAQDEPRILHQILNYLKSDTLIFQEIFVETYKARFTQIPMQSITLRIQLHSNVGLGEWRDQFMVYCDEINVDAVMEPEKW